MESLRTYPTAQAPGSRLEIYVVHHPDDQAGAVVSKSIREHFHGSAFEGLADGSIEVYERASHWEPEDEAAPRPIPGVHAGELLPPAADFVAIVPVLGPNLLFAVETRPDWESYLTDIAIARSRSPERIGVFVFDSESARCIPNKVSRALGDVQFAVRADIPDMERYRRDAPAHNRVLAQGMAQLIGGRPGSPVQVFVSHSKHSSSRRRAANAELLTEQIISRLRSTRLKQYFDAKDLQPNTDWREALRHAAGSSALLSVRTDLYSSREWCQIEVHEAKRNAMPIVIADALCDGERGSFLMDNVPRLPIRFDPQKRRWKNSDIERAINRLIDAFLVSVLWNSAPSALSDGTDARWSTALRPEPTTLSGWLKQESETIETAKIEALTIEHPDPPLGAEERNVLRELSGLAAPKATLTVRTPTTEWSTSETGDDDAPGSLAGFVVGVSVSESEDITRLGLSPEHVVLALQQIIRTLLVGGASIVYGGRIERSEHTDVLWSTVEKYARPNRPARMFLALPVHRRMSRTALRATIARAPELAQVICLDEDGSTLHDPLGVAAELNSSSDILKCSLTALRSRMSQEVDAQIVVGGKRQKYEGRMPGVLEETLFALRNRKPVFVAGGFGGVADDVRAVLDGGWPLSDRSAVDSGSRHGLSELAELTRPAEPPLLDNGLTHELRRLLAVTHRGSEIAQLIQLGLQNLKRDDR